MITFTSIDELRARAGQEIGASDWLAVTQDRIDAFAAATGDHQWIHVDVERARRETPFGTTIAHGFLTLSLISALMRDTIAIEGLRMTINYGLNRVRFVSPLPAGTRVRALIALGNVADTPDSVQATWNVIVEREGGDKPCVVAEWIVRYYPAPEHDARPEGQDAHHGRKGREQ
jgi:acyl dehydratase